MSSLYTFKYFNKSYLVFLFRSCSLFPFNLTRSQILGIFPSHKHSSLRSGQSTRPSQTRDTGITIDESKHSKQRVLFNFRSETGVSLRKLKIKNLNLVMGMAPAVGKIDKAPLSNVDVFYKT